MAIFATFEPSGGRGVGGSRLPLARSRNERFPYATNGPPNKTRIRKKSDGELLPAMMQAGVAVEEITTMTAILTSWTCLGAESMDEGASSMSARS